MTKKKNETINVDCKICKLTSSYDEQSLKESKLQVNGEEILLCSSCEDNLFEKLLEKKVDLEKIEKILLTRFPQDDVSDIIEMIKGNKEL